MEDVTGATAMALESARSDDVIDQLNNAGGSRPWAWLVAVVAFLLGAALMPFGWIVWIPAVPVTWWLVLRERARRAVVLFYDVHDAPAEWFAQLVESWSWLTGSSKLWRVVESGQIRTTYQHKTNAGASDLVTRMAASASLIGPKRLHTNVAVPSLTAGGSSLYFLPDRVLVRDRNSYSDLPYDMLTTRGSEQQVIERAGGGARDATQVGKTWQYVNVKGGPDRRYSNNPVLPIMLYGEVDLRSRHGLQWRLQTSRVAAAPMIARVLTDSPTLRARDRGVSKPTARTAAPIPPRPGAPTRQSSTPPASGVRIPFAEPGMRGHLFAYGGSVRDLPRGAAAANRYAVIDLETTGLSPTRDRIIELAVAIADGQGTLVDEFATLIDPEISTIGASHIHGIAAEDLDGAPTFRAVLPELLDRLDHAVVVAHNAPFEEAFLFEEMRRCGSDALTVGLPCLDTLWLAQATWKSRPTSRNNRLATLARYHNCSSPDAHTALGDIRMLAQVLPHLLESHSQPVHYPVPPRQLAGQSGVVRPRTRAVALRKGTDGWMASVMARLPESTVECESGQASEYLTALIEALADNILTRSEAETLAALAGQAGMGKEQLRHLHIDFLSNMRAAALEDDVLTRTEIKRLHAAAKSLGLPSYYDDLQPSAPKLPSRRYRCGSCRQPGHTRRTCPN